MKPPPFKYHDPRTVAETVELLARNENAKILAGGQSLMPMLNMRYVQPDHVIDINRVEGLSYIREAGGRLEIGAMTRQREIEYADLVARRAPIVREAILNVGHRQTRNRGTLGGSLSHLDPAAELPLVSAALEATVHVQGPKGKRDIAMAEFPAGYMSPSIELDEMVIGVTLPVWPDGHGYGFVEFSRRHGDFAIVAAAVLLDVEAGGKIKRASVTVGGVGPSPVRCRDAEKALTGEKGAEAAFRAAAETCRTIDAMEDVYAPAWYRQHLATVMTRRAMVAAFGRAANAR
ncbi:MAG: xanthine dehydrogenase family protein subunit M [Alphaproteobacteria bacterium]|nr:xanthine dehydrogenase family protein subunit M [Alphaproteobacteria bacterium]